MELYDILAQLFDLEGKELTLDQVGNVFQLLSTYIAEISGDILIGNAWTRLLADVACFENSRLLRHLEKYCKDIDCEETNDYTDLPFFLILAALEVFYEEIVGKKEQVFRGSITAATIKKMLFTKCFHDHNPRLSSKEFLFTQLFSGLSVYYLLQFFCSTTYVYQKYGTIFDERKRSHVINQELPYIGQWFEGFKILTPHIGFAWAKLDTFQLLLPKRFGWAYLDEYYMKPNLFLYAVVDSDFVNSKTAKDMEINDCQFVAQVMREEHAKFLEGCRDIWKRFGLPNGESFCSFQSRVIRPGFEKIFGSKIEVTPPDKNEQYYSECATEILGLRNKRQEKPKEFVNKG